ncbi:MAG TPA: hypothetical protein PKD64_03720 [Pirellulaceae bacterium]|nr:hypothetical protein [Pirellulaceae bacterium]HMO91279.1 hypothetical protein [Pirellulaceae bacterium]HMP68537.1 hypothetical protein [Pirellulaceae bacterium]
MDKQIDNEHEEIDDLEGGFDGVADEGFEAPIDSDQQEPHFSGLNRLLVSFILVAGVYVGLMVGLTMAYVGLLAWLSPAGFELLGEEPARFEQALKQNPLLIFPTRVTVSFCGCGILLSVLAGWFVAGRATFSPLSHVGFLGFVVFVTILQLALTKPAAPAWLLMTCLFLFPTAIFATGYARSMKFL